MILEEGFFRSKELAEAGKLHTYIDKVYSVDETTDAIQYLLSSHASGKVVITIWLQDFLLANWYWKSFKKQMT